MISLFDVLIIEALIAVSITVVGLAFEKTFSALEEKIKNGNLL